MQATVLASSHYLHTVHDDGLPPLGAALAEACRIPLRRVDRFVQLAVMGSARCIKDHEPAADCGVYMASALGPMASNIRVHETMLREHMQPRPFDFINTLGGSAGFYIASNLNLSGPHMFTGSDQALLAAMAGALLDLHAGVVTQALVGVVEEAPLPLSAQRQRLRVPEHTPLAEGSHWWLLGRTDAHVNGIGNLRLQPHDGGSGLRDCLDATDPHDLRIACSRDLAPDCVRAIGQRHAQMALPASATDRPVHGSAEAAWFADAMTRDPRGPVILVGRERLLHFGT